MNIIQLDKDKPASVGQTVPESILGRSLRQAAANPLNPKIAAELIVRAADMIDGLGATLIRSKESFDQMAKTASEALARADAAEAALEQVRQENRDLAEQLAKAQEAISGIGIAGSAAE